MGAGVDNLLSDPTLPQVPILRIIDPLMAERMATWVLWGCINIQVGECMNVVLLFSYNSSHVKLHHKMLDVVIEA